MCITCKLKEKDPTLEKHNESEWSGGGNASEYWAFNSGGIECETGEFLFGMIQILKPENVLETGTHYGVGASYMAMGLMHNNKGHLDTIEFLPEIHRVAVERIKKLDLEPWVTCYLNDVAKFTPDRTYQMILLDTEPQTRFAEFLKFWPYLAPGGFIFIHDLHQHMHQVPNEEHGFAWPYGPIPEAMKAIINSGEARPFHFETPRGLTGFYKVHPNDYKWQ